VLRAALEGTPSHAYLFHGPAGTGKSTAAAAFASELLAEGADDPESVRHRVAAGTHPDLTWVRPTGAHVMRVEDVEGPVVSAATRTPFEATRRVFVLERVEVMNDGGATRVRRTHGRGAERASKAAGGAGSLRASDPADRGARPRARDRALALPARPLRSAAGP